LRPRSEIRQPTLGVALWRTEAAGAEADAVGARAVAALLRAALSQLPAVTPVFHDGGVAENTGWAAVGLAGAPDELAPAGRAAPRLAGGLPARGVRRGGAGAAALDGRALATSAGSPATEAESLARAPFAPPLPARDRERARTLADRLWRAHPEWLPLR